MHHQFAAWRMWLLAAMVYITPCNMEVEKCMEWQAERSEVGALEAFQIVLIEIGMKINVPIDLLNLPVKGLNNPN
jgi:hypothetical protein